MGKFGPNFLPFLINIIPIFDHFPPKIVRWVRALRDKDGPDHPSRFSVIYMYLNKRDVAWRMKFFKHNMLLHISTEEIYKNLDISNIKL